MKVSIIVNSYNYADFVGAAIDSALGQTYPDREVIVVDDGSTDTSWDVIRRYDGRIKMLRQANGGQGAAYNTGFALSRGEAVLFLDSDDLLDPQAVERCVAQMTPGVAMVPFRLRLVGPDARPIGGYVPYLMHSGDVTPIIRRFGHYAGPPASGNFYRRTAIAAAFPLEAHWRRAADTVPFITAPFFGSVAPIADVLGSYRQHSPGAQSMGILGNVNTSLASALIATDNRRAAVLQQLTRRTGITVAGPFLPLPWILRTRALSLRLEPQRHPYKDDRAVELLRLQRESLRHWPGYSRSEKALMLGWLACALALPAPLLRQFAASNSAGAAKLVVKRMLGARG
jgi:hypothetical protein